MKTLILILLVSTVSFAQEKLTAQKGLELLYSASRSVNASASDHELLKKSYELVKKELEAKKKDEKAK